MQARPETPAPHRRAVPRARLGRDFCMTVETVGRISCAGTPHRERAG